MPDDRGSIWYMQPTNIRNITRYTYLKTAFQGWRVSISRGKKRFTRYFSDKVFGSGEASFAAALELRDRILAELKAEPDHVEEVFNRHR